MNSNALVRAIRPKLLCASPSNTTNVLVTRKVVMLTYSSTLEELNRLEELNCTIEVTTSEGQKH